MIIQFNSAQEAIGTFLMEQHGTIYTGGLVNDGDSAIVGKDRVRPATEAEILQEAQKHGWRKKDHYEYTFNGFEVYKSPFTGWVLLSYVPIETETLGQSCKDGSIVDRLITALNLVNN